MPSYDKIEVSDVNSLNEMINDFDYQHESSRYPLTQACSLVSLFQNGENQSLQQAKQNLVDARQKKLQTSARPLLKQTA